MIEMLSKCLSAMDRQQRFQFYVLLVLVFVLVILEASGLIVLYGVISMVEGLLGDATQSSQIQWMRKIFPNSIDPDTPENALYTAKSVIFLVIGLFIIRGLVQFYVI